MEDIKMVKKPNYFEIKVNFEEVDKNDAITRMDRRGGMGHPQVKGKSEMEIKCKKFSGCDGVHTVKAGSITEHFISYKNKKRRSDEFLEDNVDLIKNIENLYYDGKTFQKEEKPYPVEKEVEYIQTALQFLGFSLPKWGVDGRFGPETEKAVSDFQKDNSLNVTGVMDKDGLKKLAFELDEKGFSDEDMGKIQKNKSDSIEEDPSIPENIVIGDSQAPYVANGSEKFELISTKGSEDSLWLGGKTLSWLLSAVRNHEGSKAVKNIAICIGTNGAFNTNDNISGLITELETKFPNANLYVIQGSWGWGGLKNMTESKVRKYYKKFEENGVTVIEPPIGDIEPHGNKPVYKKIGTNLDSKV